MKKTPNYVSSRFQSTFYISLGILAGGYNLAGFANSGDLLNLALFVGFVGMASNVAIKRFKWKRNG